MSILQFGNQGFIPCQPSAFVLLLMRELRYEKLLKVGELIKDWDLECRISNWLHSLLSQAITKKKKKRNWHLSKAYWFKGTVNKY